MKRRYRITVEGQAHDVEVVTLEDGQAEVTVDGQRRVVTSAAGGEVLVRADEGGAQHRVVLPAGPKPEHGAVGSKVVGLRVQTAREAAFEAASGATGAAGSGSGTIGAPMPGRIVKLLVAEGDEVAADAPVIIVEAMKMENEVCTPVAGTVKSIDVAAGDTVDAGQPMLHIEPAPG